MLDWYHSPRQQVFAQHNRDQGRLYAFIDNNWPLPRGQQNGREDGANVCYLLVSTTLHSTVFLLSIGVGSAFTHNTYSDKANNPWLIHSDVVVNLYLARFIRREWNEMFRRARLRDDGQNPVNDIAPHVLFDVTDARFPPSLVNLTCDGNNVRANVRDIEVWSHPPRDEPLRAVVEERGYSQSLGLVRASARQWRDIHTNNHIPTELIRQERLQEKKQEFQRRFNELCTSLQGDLPNSFQWPTIQLKQVSQHGQGQQRYGNTAAGVHDERTNEVHNKFSANGVEARNTNRNVFNALVASEITGVDFDSLMPEG